MRYLLLTLLLINQTLSASETGESLTFRGKGQLSDGRAFTSRLIVSIGERDEGLPLDYRLDLADGSTEQIKIKLLPPTEEGEQDQGSVEMAGKVVGSWSGGPTTDAETMTINFSDDDTDIIAVLKFKEDDASHVLIPFVIRASVSKITADTTLSWQDTLRLDFTSVF